MDFGLTLSIVVALALFRLVTPILDRVANRVLGNPRSAATGKAWREVGRVPVDPLRPELGDMITFAQQ